jgi:hypothetical protein
VAGLLCGWEDAGSFVIPMRRGFCVDALPVDICAVSEVGSMVTISVDIVTCTLTPYV